MNKMNVGKMGTESVLTPTSLLHKIPSDSSIFFRAEDPRMYAFLFKFCSLRYDAATSVGKIISSYNKEVSCCNTKDNKKKYFISNEKPGKMNNVTRCSVKKSITEELKL
jgi:hypothetical protein